MRSLFRTCADRINEKLRHPTSRSPSLIEDLRRIPTEVCADVFADTADCYHLCSALESNGAHMTMHHANLNFMALRQLVPFLGLRSVSAVRIEFEARDHIFVMVTRLEIGHMSGQNQEGDGWARLSTAFPNVDHFKYGKDDGEGLLLMNYTWLSGQVFPKLSSLVIHSSGLEMRGIASDVRRRPLKLFHCKSHHNSSIIAALMDPVTIESFRCSTPMRAGTNWWNAARSLRELDLPYLQSDFFESDVPFRLHTLKLRQAKERHLNEHRAVILGQKETLHRLHYTTTDWSVFSALDNVEFLTARMAVRSNIAHLPGKVWKLKITHNISQTTFNRDGTWTLPKNIRRLVIVNYMYPALPLTLFLQNEHLLSACVKGYERGICAGQMCEENEQWFRSRTRYPQYHYVRETQTLVLRSLQ